jgi:hypothetical protein
MQVQFTPEQEAQIAKIAGAEGTAPEAFVKRAALNAASRSVEHVHPLSADDANRAVQRILELQRSVKSDPEGWTVKDYIDYGRP